jgi:Transposase DDE domain
MPGNVSDFAPVASLARDLTGKLFGDKGYRQETRGQAAAAGAGAKDQGTQKMKSRSMTLTNKMLLNARNMAESVISYIKVFFLRSTFADTAPCQFLHSRHRLSAQPHPDPQSPENHRLINRIWD